MLEARVKPVKGEGGLWWTLDITTDLQISLDNTVRGEGNKDACGGIRLGIFRPTPAQLRDMAQTLMHGASEMEKKN